MRCVVVLALLLACARGDARADVRFDVDGRQVVFHAELADSSAEQVKGLSGRQTLAPDAGMLFVWSDVAPRTFWMKDTLIPLDLIAIRAGRVVGVHQLEPCEADPCPLTRTRPADAALEVNAGAAARAGITVGVLVDAPGIR